MSPKKAGKKSVEKEDVEMAAPVEEAPKSPKKEEAPKSPKSPKKEEPVEGEAPKSPVKAPEPPPKPAKVFDVEHSFKVADDKRAKSTFKTAMNPEDSSLSLMIDGSHCSTISRDGFHCLLSGGRATTGVQSGRYMFEVKVLELTPFQQGQGPDWKAIRVGFGTANSNLVAGSDGLSVGLDNDGGLWESGKPKRASSFRWTVGDVIGVFVNLDKASEQVNTMSVFKNGFRVCEPIKLPEAMHGKVIFPMVAVRCAAVGLNFGSNGARPQVELPFQARMIDDAASADVVATKVVAPASGKYDVVTVVGLPNEGTYDYLDLEFYPKNTGSTYVEISKRALMKACDDSGMAGIMHNVSSYNFGEMTNGILMTAYRNLATTKRRHVVIMDVSKSLTQSDRMAQLKGWKAAWFVKKAICTIGAPPAAFSKQVQKSMVDAETAKKTKVVTAEKTLYESNLARKKDAATRLFEKQKETALAKGEPEPEAPMEAEETTPDWAEKMKVDATVYKDLVFRPADGLLSDMSPEAIGRSFDKFTLPVEGAVSAAADKRWLADGQEMPTTEGGDGYDVVEFAWVKRPAAAKYLNDYQKQRKVVEKFVEVEIGSFCKDALEEWAQKRTDLKRHADLYLKQKKRRAQKKLDAIAAEKKAAAKAEKEAAEAAAKAEKEAAAAAAKAEAAAKAAAEKAEKGEEGEEAKEGEEAEKKDEEMAEAPKSPKSPKKEEKKDDDVEMVSKEDADLDVSVDDEAGPVAIKKVSDIESIDGKSTPLYKTFSSEDWLLMHMRAELSILVAAFKKDVTAKDADRKGMTVKLLPFYYRLYFQKELLVTNYGFKTPDALVEYFSDVVKIADDVLVAVSKETLPVTAWVKTTEEQRRERETKIDAGDEEARLAFVSVRGNKGPSQQAQKGAAPFQQKGGKVPEIGAKGAAPFQQKGGKGMQQQFAGAPAAQFAGKGGFGGGKDMGKGYGAPQSGAVKRPFDAGAAAPYDNKRPRPTGAPVQPAPYGGKGGYGGKGWGK